MNHQPDLSGDEFRSARHLSRFEPHSTDSSTIIAGMGTAVPPYRLPQELALDVVRSMFGSHFPDFAKRSKLFETAGIDNRYSAVPPEWFRQEHTIGDRNAQYMRAATSLFIDAAQNALDDAGLMAEEVDIVVTVSSTGIATPTLEALAMQEMGFSTHAKRIPVFGLGCAGGVSGLSIASQLARANPDATVLLVAVELCTLSFRKDNPGKAALVASALFGDGAAAVCLQSSTHSVPGDVIVGDGVEHTWEGTLDIMGWDVEDQGLGVIFDRSIPDFVSSHFREAADQALARLDIDIDDVTRFICHPGGAKVLTALESALELDTQTLDHERAILHEFGNMSAPTALFVLQRAIRHEAEGDYLLAALGPGFTASFLKLEIK
ncbi:MAG: type III polyketide synthase [Pseudomonadota bacterium]